MHNLQAPAIIFILPKHSVQWKHLSEKGYENFCGRFMQSQTITHIHFEHAPTVWWVWPPVTEHRLKYLMKLAISTKLIICHIVSEHSSFWHTWMQYTLLFIVWCKCDTAPLSLFSLSLRVSERLDKKCKSATAVAMKHRIKIHVWEAQDTYSQVMDRCVLYMLEHLDFQLLRQTTLLFLPRLNNHPHIILHKLTDLKKK